MDSFFKDDGLHPEIDIKMPGSEMDLASKKDIGKEVHKEYVSTVIVEEEDVIRYPMFCIHAKKLQYIPPHASVGLRALINTCKVDDNAVDDTTHVYMLRPNGGMSKIGSGSFNKLYMYLDNFVKTAINNKLKVYYFEAEGRKGEKIDKGDPSKIKLDI